MLNFLLIFIDKKDNYGLTICQRFSEIYCFNILKPQNKSENEKHDLHFLINTTNAILKKLNNEIYEILVNYLDSNPSCALTWILTFFGICFDNVIFQFRFLDYFICSHPISVYFLSCKIFTDELSKILKEKEKKVRIFIKNHELEFSEVFQHFKNLNFKQLDFDDYIEKTDKLVDESLINNFSDFFSANPELNDKRLI